MAEWKKRTWSLIASVASLAILASVSTASDDTAGTGECRIQGEHIKLLVLQHETGKEQVLSEPGSSVILPVGEYRLQRIVLEGDHSCEPSRFPAGYRLTVEPNTPAILKVGAPLRQVIQADRQGPVMALTYKLIGQGGEQYSINRTPNGPPPSFAVYKGGRKVASGNFEYG